MRATVTVLQVTLLAAAACGGATSEHGAALGGSVAFALQIPDGQLVGTIALTLSCPESGVQQEHSLDVRGGNVEASFGGLAPGDCTALARTATPAGYLCAGATSFTMWANQRTDAVITLVCQGTNQSDDGAATLSSRFDVRACADDRIRSVYAIPSNVLTSESTLVSVTINSNAVRGTAKPFRWALRNDLGSTAEGYLSEGTCTDSVGCAVFTCTGLGASSEVDTRTGLPSAGVFVTVTYEDDDCFDTEEVFVLCLRASVCGDGVVEGSELCDDGNTVADDGCSDTCVAEFCGDGIVQPGLGEQCDGSSGLAPGQVCSSSCQPRYYDECFDGIATGDEECDGLDGLLPGQVCGAPGTPNQCKIIPTCGNGIVEAGEECDDGTTFCLESCRLYVPIPPCQACLDALPDIGEFNKSVCHPDAQCRAALACLQDNPSCWTGLAPASCFCGDTQVDLDNCENPSFTPRGACADELRAGTGNGSNTEVLERYFDPDYPGGRAAIIHDAAFVNCKFACF